MAVKNLLTSDITNLLNVPKITLTKRDLITTPQNGTLIYLLDNNELQYYNGTDWITLTEPVVNQNYLNSYFLQSTQTYGTGINLIGSTNNWASYLSNGTTDGWENLGNGNFKNLIPGLWSISIHLNFQHTGVAANDSISVIIQNTTTTQSLCASIYAVTPTAELPYQCTLFTENIVDVVQNDEYGFFFSNNTIINFNILGGMFSLTGMNTYVIFKKIN